MNSKIKTGSMFLLAAVLVAGTISITIPSSFAEPGVNIQKIKCINSNFNVNGVEINQLPQEEPLASGAQADEVGAAQNGEGNGLLDGGLNIDRILVNICANININGQADGFDPRILE